MIPETLILIAQAIYYVVEIIQVIMASEVWGDFIDWFKSQNAQNE